MRSLYLLLALLVCAPATPTLAAAVVTATPARPMPTETVTFAGTGFAASEAIDIYYDTSDVKLVVSSASGAFSTSFQIPQYESAPGSHTLTAVGRRAGDAAQAAIIVTTPWRQVGFGNSHRGWNPYESTLSASDLGTLWINNSLTGNGSTPAVVYPNVYVTLHQGVAALKAATGEIVWRVLPGQSFYGSPTVANYVYVASYTGNVIALNPATGATIWSRALGGNCFSSPAVVGGILYIGNAADNKLYALNASTGATVWTYTSGGTIYNAATVANGFVYFGSYDDKVYALNATTGALVWTYTTGGFVQSSPVVVNGTLYTGSADGNVYALSADDGTLRWAYATGQVVLGAPAVVSGTVYAGSDKMYAIDAKTGTTTNWTFTPSDFARAPSVANGYLYFTSDDGTFYALYSYDGSLANTAKLGGTYLGAPAISDGVLYLNDFFGNTSIRAVTSNAESMAAAKKPKQPPKPSELHPDLSLKASK